MFRADFVKQYEAMEHQSRVETSADNLEFVESENNEGLIYTLGLNIFTDMTTEEFAMGYMGYKPSKKLWGELMYLGSREVLNETLPDLVDWTRRGP
mmetsp:Transcript_13001/g.34598  ORF Transcript_13001/g.34598 Transcript_13001/m.34598 type:complete len:96 (+) Transcript_13001:182-469(+)